MNHISLLKKWMKVCFCVFLLSLHFECMAYSENSIDEDTLAKKERPIVYLLSEYDGKLKTGKPVILSIEDVVDEPNLTYQWFECKDRNGKDACRITNAMEAEYVTAQFEKKEIRYYFCEVEQYTPQKNKELPIFIVSYTGLPTVYLDGDLVWNQEDWVVSDITIIPGETGGEYMTARINYKGRGNSTWVLSPKCSYTLRFGKSTRLFDLAVGEKYVLLSNYADKTLLRNWWAGYLCQDVFYKNQWNPKCVQVDVFLNGTYIGNYSITEQIRFGPERIDRPTIKDIYKKTHNVDALKYGGYILEIDQRESDDPQFITDRGVCFHVVRPDLNDFAENEKQLIVEYIHKHVQLVENKICGLDGEKTYDSWYNFIDVESVVNWYLMKELAKDADSNFYSSVFLYYDPIDEIFHMGPQWDFDLAFGNHGSGKEDPPEEWIINNVWFDAFKQSSVFNSRLKERWKEVKTQLLERAIPVLINKSKKMQVSADLNFERWQILGRSIWNRSLGAEQRTTYKSEVDYLVNWTVRRIDWMSKMLEML